MNRITSAAAALLIACIASPVMADEEDPSAPFYVPGEPVRDDQIRTFFYGNRLEAQSREGDETFIWDIDSYVGQDMNKLWLKSEGEYNLDAEMLESGTIEPLYSRPVSAYWDIQAGVRYEAIENADDRVFASIGVQGLAPGFFQVDPTVLVSSEGDVSLTAEVEYDQLLTQRLILQPRVAFNVQAQDVPEYGLASGLTDFELGLRLRYEITREVAPYVGVNWIRAVGDTADMTRASGGQASQISGIAGFRILF